MSDLNIVVHFSHKCKDKIDRGEYKHGRYDIAITYGIRKRWDTIAKQNLEVNRDIIEKMFGHSSRIPLDNGYFKPVLEKMFDEYKKLIPDLKVYSVKSGEKYYDWIIPDEWHPKKAWIKNNNGDLILDFKNNNLHLIGYSKSVDKWVDLSELDKHLYSLPKQPNAIPYVTSYYKKQWGFCIRDKDRKKLKKTKYHVYIDADLKPGVLNYGEIIIKGKTNKEVFLSTYICHPSLANNELSGPVVATALARWIKKLKNKKYTYRIVFIPETIGSIVYLSKNLKKLKKNIIAGYNITCVGDDRCYSYLPSRNGKTLSDKVALHVLKHTDPEFKRYTWLDRGGDERQYCAPGVDLPIASITRSKFGEYSEYHTSMDNLELVTPTGLEGGYIILRKVLEIIEQNISLKTTMYGEPQLSKRNLYPSMVHRRMIFPQF